MDIDTELETKAGIPHDAVVTHGEMMRVFEVVDRADVSVLRDSYTAKFYVLFYTIKCVGGGVQGFDTIRLITE